MKITDKHVVIVFVLLYAALFLAVLWGCEAKAAKKSTLKPLCGAGVVHQMVFVGMLEDQFWDDHAEKMVAWWNDQLGFQAVKYYGRLSMTYGTDEKPGYIGIRSAPLDLVKAWESKADTRNRAGIARSLFNRPKNTCRHGTAIWIKERCIVDVYTKGCGCVTEKYLFLLLVHEMGHALGFRHSEYRYSIMHHQIVHKHTKLELAPDTKADLAEMYGSIK